MVSRGRRKPVDLHQAEKYRRVGAALLESGRALHTIAEDVDRFGNAIAVVAIHAAIAYVDALTIAYAGFKSTEGDHLKATATLQDALGNRADPRKVKLLRSILQIKDTVSYSGTFYRVTDASKTLHEVVEFAQWAEDLYEERPRGAAL